MATEVGPIYVGTFTLVTNNVPQVLTTRDIRCKSVFLLPKSGDVIYLCDSATPSLKFTIPAAGLALPLERLNSILLDGVQDGDICDWTAV